MKKEEFVISCGNIQPDALELPKEEIIAGPTLQGNEKIKAAIRLFR